MSHKLDAEHPRRPKSHLCRWGCGRETWNHSGICDECWRRAEVLRSNSDDGYKAWCERWRAKEAAKEKRPMSAKQKAALRAARGSKLLKQSLSAATFDGG